MVLNKVNCELLKSRGYRYLVVQKRVNIIRTNNKELKDAVFDYFDFSVSNVLVDIYDLVLDRYLKFEEYKKEWQEMIEYQKRMGWNIIVKGENVGMTEIKNCPFCGSEPKLEHDFSAIRERDNCAEIRISWKVRCNHCGCEKSGGFSDYYINDFGELVLKSGGYEQIPTDAMKEAVKKWNTRSGE